MEHTFLSGRRTRRDVVTVCGGLMVKFTIMPRMSARRVGVRAYLTVLMAWMRMLLGHGGGRTFARPQEKERGRRPTTARMSSWKRSGRAAFKSQTVGLRSQGCGAMLPVVP